MPPDWCTTKSSQGCALQPGGNRGLVVAAFQHPNRLPCSLLQLTGYREASHLCSLLTWRVWVGRRVENCEMQGVQETSYSAACNYLYVPCGIARHSTTEKFLFEKGTFLMQICLFPHATDVVTVRMPSF